ncbi:putative fungal specific transcription factor [Golovinomyces cichoracearum]|uniref:Putative fungal specific transcription factor n=1 Tax=Golovinomyces cichoracearum TaxID=62708 RepID=A0A420J2V3_9PEZI|nr:putative fungal specific transcription factor [Golovinomyces cichoracearum]
MSLYGSHCADGVSEHQLPKAPQACITCRKQKRKCSKTLPACALCQRMNRHCDYSDSAPAPTSEDFNALRMKLAELESRLRYGERNFAPIHADIATPSSRLSSHDEPIRQLQQISTYCPPHEASWPGIRSKFPSIAFLHGLAFSSGGISVPRPNFSTPPDILEVLACGSTVEASTAKFFASVHQWIPILCKEKLTRSLVKPLWEIEPDLCFLFLCIKLLATRPKDCFDCSQNEIYLTAKRFIALAESIGLISLYVLQANILISIYEYGHAIYPAAWMSSGWSVRYGNLLGISGDKAAIDLIGKSNSKIDQEEYRRAWWGVLIVDRIISIGNMGYIVNPQEPQEEDLLPMDENSWEKGELSSTPQLTVSTPISEHVTSFPRLCQAYMLMGQVMIHHKGYTVSESSRFTKASQLYTNISDLARKISEELLISKDFFSLISPLALSFSSICYLCNPYCCLDNVSNEEQRQIQTQAIDGLKTIAISIIDFADQVNIATQTVQDLDRVSPFITDGIYAGSLTLAWLTRENGDESYQAGLGSLRQCLIKLSTRWRNAAEYVRILEAHEFAFALTQNST